MRRNWWKYGFFVALIACEVLRELLVMTIHQQPIGPIMSVHGFPGVYVSAEGAWIRPGSTDQLGPHAVKIVCDAESQLCTETQADIDGNAWYGPYLFLNSNTYPVEEWADDSVTYVKDDATCVRYFTRIDLAQKRVTSTRTIRPNKARDQSCSFLDAEMQLELSDGLTHSSLTQRPLPPLLAFITKVMGAFD